MSNPDNTPTAADKIARVARLVFATFGWPLLLLAATAGGGGHIAAYVQADRDIAQHCIDSTDYYEQSADCTRALAVKAEINAFIFHALRFGLVAAICGAATAALFSRTRAYLTKAMGMTAQPILGAGAAIALAIVLLAMTNLWAATA